MTEIAKALQVSKLGVCGVPNIRLNGEPVLGRRPHQPLWSSA
jgi:hypothetical protein